MFVYFSFDDLFLHLLWRNLLAAEDCLCLEFVCSSFIHLALWNLKNWWLLVSLLLRISIVFWRGLRAWWLRKSEDFSTFSKRLNFLRLLNLFLHYVGVQICLMRKKNSCDIVTKPQLSRVETVKAGYLLGKCNCCFSCAVKLQNFVCRIWFR